LKKREIKGSLSKNKENLNKKESFALYVPGRNYQIKKEVDFDEIFVKRNKVNDWSRKSAFCNVIENQ
jgi:hypothetical protein